MSVKKHCYMSANDCIAAGCGRSRGNRACQSRQEIGQESVDSNNEWVRPELDVAAELNDERANHYQNLIRVFAMESGARTYRIHLEVARLLSYLAIPKEKDSRLKMKC
jgi:hypothetical protein